MKPSDEQIQNLMQVALAVRRNAYAPFSKFLVGAAVLATDGRVFSGCNVENASFGLTICAERNAIAAMVAADGRQIAALAVATRGAGTPCGACRQVMAEFGQAFEVILVDSDSEQILARLPINALLPNQFRMDFPAT